MFISFIAKTLLDLRRDEDNKERWNLKPTEQLKNIRLCSFSFANINLIPPCILHLLSRDPSFLFQITIGILLQWEAFQTLFLAWAVQSFLSFCFSTIGPNQTWSILLSMWGWLGGNFTIVSGRLCLCYPLVKARIENVG